MFDPSPRSAAVAHPGQFPLEHLCTPNGVATFFHPVAYDFYFYHLAALALAVSNFA
jgi:hypothetical protein